MSDHNYDLKSPRKTNAYQRMKQLCIVACPINELKHRNSLNCMQFSIGNFGISQNTEMLLTSNSHTVYFRH